MMTKDSKNKEKIFNKNPNIVRPLFKTIPGYEDQKSGIVLIAAESLDSPEEHRTMQEYHNANHALYYFCMIVEGIIRGRFTRSGEAKVARLVAHMECLREFIEEKGELYGVINELLAHLAGKTLKTSSEMCKFMYENWDLIAAFSEIYGHREKCFSDDKYQKIRDVVTGWKFLRSWYWKSRVKRFCMELKTASKKVRHG